MQIFIPYPSLSKSINCLDNKRLNKQIVECYQIIKAIKGEYKSAWVNHSVVRMYWPYVEFVSMYMFKCLERYYLLYGSDKIHKCENEYCQIWLYSIHDWQFPHWWGFFDLTNNIHDSHKSMLYKKDPVHYKQFENYKDKFENYVYPEYNKEIIIKDELVKPKFDDKKFWYLGYYQDIKNTPYESGLGLKYNPLQ